VARSGNSVANGLVSALGRRTPPCSCELTIPELFRASQAANDSQTTCIYVPSAHDRDGMTPDLAEAEIVFQQTARSGFGKLILLSSALIYGTDRGRQALVTEDYSAPGVRPRIPSNWYSLEAAAATHLRIETILTVLRPSTVLPSREFPTRRLSNRFVITLPGHDPVLQLLSFADLANAVFLAITQDKAGVFNVAPDRVVPLHTAIHGARSSRIPIPYAVQRLVKRSDTLEYLRYPWTISNAKIKRELGFSPRESSLGALLELRHRLSPAGEEPNFDDFGMDKDYIRFYGKTLFKFLSRVYWRIEDKGLEHVPRSGKGVLVGMHRGFMPWDGIMALHLLVQKTGRFPRFLTHPGLFKFPFLANFVTKLGGVVACQESAERVLKGNELLGLFPEGIHGAFVTYEKAYKLAAFGRDAFVKLALRHGAPIIPFVTVGSAEIFPIFGKIKSRLWTRYSDWPFIPITPTFPILPVPLPSKWHTQFLAPINTDQYPPEAASDRTLVKEISLKVRTSMQEALDDMLRRRPSIFFGSIFERRANENQSEPAAI
jgi:1-acyl-sn-glycerol-3-phosphate acyltransferase/nucleoside-diphosphate-sugar epimerase